MARTNLHELANRLLSALDRLSSSGRFQGKLREVAAEAGLNSVRSAEAIKLLEELGRIEVLQRGRRNRDTIIRIDSTEPITLEDAEQMLPSRATRRATRINYDDIGRAVVERLLELARDDGLRAAQVEAFAAANSQHENKIKELEEALEAALQRETELRVKLRSAEEALERAEENLRRAFQSRRPEGPAAVPDDEARALLDVLRSARP
jgi:hypothetical protein